MTPNPCNVSVDEDVEKKAQEALNCSDDSDSKMSEESSERPAWDNKLQYLMAALGFAVGLGNIWRFPYLCKKNGGGAFLIPYVIMLFVEGYPLYYLELAVGQKIRKGTIGVWTHIHPYLGGVGIASNVISLLIGLYYNMILGWAIFYLFNSFQTDLPWATCPMINDTHMVQECQLSSSTNYFWYRDTLDISYRIEDGGAQNWRMVLVLFVAWLIVFLGMNKGIKSSGKVMYFATSFPYIVLIAFFFRGMTLDGAVEGVKYMFSPDVSRLKDADVWREAATQIFFSLGLGYGSIIAYSSYNQPKNNCRKDAIFIATANCITSIFACITVFSILGFKAKTRAMDCFESNKIMLVDHLPENFPDRENLLNFTFNELLLEFNLDSSQKSTEHLLKMTNCSIESELDTDVQGTGLAFIAFTEAILKFPAAPFWSVLFFFMLLNIGMSSEFGILQTVVTSVLDSGVKVSKTKLTAGMCSCMFVVGLLFTQRSGSYFLDIFDTYSATLSLVTIALCEVLSVSYIYKMGRFEKDLKEMVGVSPGYYWTISWRFTCPLALLVILGASVAGLFTKDITYSGWNPITASKDDLLFPTWGIVLIIFLILASVSCIPVYALLYKFGYIKPDTFIFNRSKDFDEKEYSECMVTESTQPLTAKV
nr:sodium-dependent neutral amino acid transporter B(0)AT2 isoform X2 [Ciona intestinalis]|eukprot:XP_002128205.1 sodium-dependent neutral amino acid transporter B(0)AT2 isoform X2 [Ciona intestinalis]